MYFDFRTYFRFMYLAFFRSKESHFRLTAGRAVALALFFIFFPLFELFTFICLILDHLLFPGFHKIELEKPLFIVGPHRSGTTYLHRLLARDDGQFFCFRLWEIAFPSILQKKVFSLFGWLDRKLGRRLESAIRRQEVRRLGEYHTSIHETSIFDPAEDDKLTAHIFSTLALTWFVHSGELGWLMHFDQKASQKDRDRIMKFYRTCLKRQAYFKGGKRKLLSKAPFACFRIDSIYQYFPGCRMIYTIRNPLDAVPSMLDVAKRFWESGGMKGGFPHQEWAYQTVKEMYNYPLSRFAEADETSYKLVVFDDLLQRPRETVVAMYRKFGYQMREEFLQILREEDEKQRRFRSRHKYTLEQFGLCHNQILTDFEDIFDRFGFHKRISESETETMSIPDAE